MVIQIRDVELLAGGIEADAVAAAELRLDGGAAIARKALHARAGKRRDNSRFGVVDADAIVEGISEIDLAIGSDGEVVHAIEAGVRAGLAVAAIARHSLLPGQRGQDAMRIDLPHAFAFDHFDEEDTVAEEIDAERLDKLGLGRWGTIRLVAAAGHEHQLVGAGHGSKDHNQRDGDNASHDGVSRILCLGGTGILACALHAQARMPVPPENNLPGSPNNRP